MSARRGALIALIGAMSGSASAEEGWSASAAWRPTLRRAYVFYGDHTDQIPLWALVAGRDPVAGSGVANSYTELGRFEASARYGLTEDLQGYVGVLGGPMRLQLTGDGPIHEGTDWSVDLGGSIGRKFQSGFYFETVMAGRVRAWDLGDLPLHGNVGIVLGVKPQYKGFSLYVEATLAAVWLTDLTAWGAQKDSSILRIRPEYAFDVADWTLSAGLDYYHTHTEFFGSELIADQEAFMLDDFDLAAVIGVKRGF